VLQGTWCSVGGLLGRQYGSVEGAGNSGKDCTGRDADEEHSCGVYFTSGFYVTHSFKFRRGKYFAIIVYSERILGIPCLPLCPSECLRPKLLT
jgi:hypothetical protein